MQTNLHKLERTTPIVRAEIAASVEPAHVLAQRYNINVNTVYKWRKRRSFTDLSHTAHQFQTQLNPAQEKIVVHLRQLFKLPLDDLLVVTHEFLCPDVSRSGLHRCLKRHGVSDTNFGLPLEDQPSAPKNTFKDYEPATSTLI